MDDPEQLDLRRARNRHAAFGLGIHHCLGAPLARMEAQEALPRLASALRGATTVAEPPSWRPLPVSRALVSLPLTLAAR